MLLNTKTKLFIVIVIVIVVFGRLGWLNPVENFFIWVTRPVFNVSRNASLGVVNFFSNVFTIGDLENENADLKQKLVLLETENARLKIAAAEVEKLGQALNLKARTGFVLTGARVVSVDPTSLNQTLVVDRGSNSGVVLAQAVVDASGAYVGQVTRVLTNTAEITLISDFSSRLPAEVAETGARGIITGQHGLSVALIEVPQGQYLKEGGRVVTTGFTVGVPAGLFIGYVDKLRTGGSDLFQEANIAPAADLRQLRTVFIITGSN